jgi:hypothetical protein
MNDSFSYKGVVTVAPMVGGRIVSQKYYNSGTSHLFEAYAKALAGYSIEGFIPYSIDLCVASADTLEASDVGHLASVLTAPVPVTLTYHSGTSVVYDKAYNYGSPFTRAQILLTKNDVDFIVGDDLIARLMSSSNKTLAYVEIPGLGKTLKGMGAGIQLILLWDLYVTNESEDDA